MIRYLLRWYRNRRSARRWALVEAVSVAYQPEGLHLPATRQAGWDRLARILEARRVPHAYQLLDTLHHAGNLNRRQLAALRALLENL